MRFAARPLVLLLLLSLPLPAPLRAQRDTAVVLRDVRFTTGETLPEVRLHAMTMGTLRRDAAGRAANAVMLLHGTGGSGRSFLNPIFATEMFGAGQPLDTTRFFVILPDNIGHGRSTKPSDGLRMRFPRYTYDDMVDLQRRLLTEGLGVDRLLLVLGTSMGCMHAWVWATRHPEFVDGFVPLACLPAAIAGRNRMLRWMIADAIRGDPEWNGGDYTRQPRGLRAAHYILYLMSSAPLVQQRDAPTRQAADSIIGRYLETRVAAADANDMLYYFDASRDYDPAPLLGRVVRPVLHINFADDLINPPELGIAERLIGPVRGARFVLMPIGPATRGHGTHTAAAVYQPLVAPFIERLARARGLSR
jgi:homoserine O-acetyltransferase/O-succinyltransferase